MTTVVELTDEMVRAAAEGRQAERAHVLETLMPRVRLMVLARLSPTPEQFIALEDTTQRVLAALAGGLEGLVHRTVDGLNAYLSGIVTRQVATSIKHFAGTKIAGVPVVSLDSTVTGFSRAGPLWELLSSSGVSPHGAAERTEQVAKLMTELGRLKPTYREVITMAFFDELAMEEIGRKMGTSRAAASMLFMRAMKTLRRNLTGSSRIGQGDGNST